MRQAYLDALSNPGKVTTPGAQMLPGTSPTGPQSQPSVLAQFLQQHPGGGTTGGGGYSNQGFFTHPERAEAGSDDMIGTELLQLLQGDPLAQMRQQMGGPNPNPQAPPPQPAAPPTMPVGARPGSQRGIGPGTPMGPTPAMPPGVSPNTIAGPAPQGGPPAPGGPAPPPSPLPQSGPPSVASQSPPDLVQLYSRLMQQQRAGSAIDHGLALMASAYAAPGTQGQIMHSMDNQQPDASSMMNNLVQLQQMQRINNMPAPGSGGGATGGAASGDGQPAIDPTVWNALPPDAKMKILEQRAQSSLAVSQAAQEAQGKDVEEFKNSGIQDFSAANQKLTDSQTSVDQLLKNMPATMKALSDPDILTTSKWAAWRSADPARRLSSKPSLSKNSRRA